MPQIHRVQPTPKVMSHLNKPKFSPTPCTSSTVTLQAASHSPDVAERWIPILSSPADFPPDLFETAVSQLIHHPEYNSTLILRSEVVSDTTETLPSSVPSLDGFIPIRNIHRKLLPRRPLRDAGLEQHCTLYAPSDSPDPRSFPCILVLTPIFDVDTPLPYYHPTVTHLAFRYIPASTAPATLRIEAIPLPGTPLDPNARLYRTCLALLETLHRYGWGALTQYKKRVIHDTLVPREIYQDLYLVMRERHKHIVDQWQEVTDPLKHVFEDIGIATFLMLLWKDTYASDKSDATSEPLAEEPWKHWPRPPGGFVDLGCGNGLLTHILVSEGYAGHGLDLRARTSWSHYPPPTRAALHVAALDPTSPYPGPTPHLPRGSFLIGNHADELTPWVPVLATRTAASGYLSIPCCAWVFDARYDRARHAPCAPVDADALNLGGDGSNASSYSMYRIWLAALSARCGWAVECETLRIPSTRNWAIVGRAHKEGEEWEKAKEHVEEIVEDVRRRGIFKTRKPEGKAGDH